MYHTFDFVDHNKLENSYLSPEKLVWRSKFNRTGHETTDWFKIGTGARQYDKEYDRILSSCLFNLYAEYIMWNAWLDDSQAGIKTARKNINNLRYAGDITLMAESKEELKPFDEGKKGEWKS